MSVRSTLAKLEKLAKAKGLGECPGCRNLPIGTGFGYRPGDAFPPLPRCPLCGKEGQAIWFGVMPGMPEMDELLPRDFLTAKEAQNA